MPKVTPLERATHCKDLLDRPREFCKTLSMGAAWTIRAAAFLIPLLLVLVLLVAGVRRLRRTRT